METRGADQGGWMAPGDLALVTDPHTDTCYSETSQHDVIVYRVHLPQEVEVHTVTAVTPGRSTRICHTTCLNYFMSSSNSVINI